MTSGIRAPGGHSRHGARRLLAIAVVIVSVPVLAWLLRDLLIAPSLKRMIVSSVGARLGVPIAIDRLGGSYFTSLELRGLRSLDEGAGNGALRFTARELHARYAPLSLLAGVGAFVSSLRIELDGAAIELDLDRAAGAGKTGSAVQALPTAGSLPGISVRDSSLVVRRGSDSLSLAGLSLEARAAGGAAAAEEITVGVARASVRHPSLSDRTASLSATLRYAGGELTTDEILLDGKPLLQAARLGLSGFPRDWSFEGALSLLQGTLALHGERQNGLFALGWKTDGVRLDTLSTLVTVPDFAMRGLLATAGEFTLDPANLAGTRGELTLHLADAAVHGVPIRRLDLDASVGDGLLRCALLEVEVPANVLSARNVSLPARFLLGDWGVPRPEEIAGEFSLSLGDVPSLLALAGVSLPQRGAVPPHHIELEGSIRQGDAALRTGRLDIGGGSAVLRRGRLRLPSAGQTWKEISGELSLSLDFRDLSLLPRVFPIPALEGSLKGTVDLEGTPAAPRGTFELMAGNLRIGAYRLDALEARGRAARGEVFLADLRARRGADRASARGTFLTSRPYLKEVSLEISGERLADYTRELLPAGMRLESAFSGVVEASILGESLRIRNLTLRLGENEASLLDAAIPWNVLSGKQWHRLREARIARWALRIADPPSLLAIVGGEARSWLREPAPPMVINATGSMQGGSVAFAEGKLAVAEARLLLSKGMLTLPAEPAAWREIGIGGEIEVRIPDLGIVDAFLPSSGLGGALQGKIVAGGRLGAPAGSLDLTVKGLSWKGRPIGDADIKASADGGGFAVESLLLRRGEDALSFAGRLARGVRGESDEIRIERLSLSHAGRSADLQRPARMIFSRRGGLVIEGLLLGGTAGTIRIAGSVPYDPFAPPAERILAGALSLEATGDLPDLQALNIFLPRNPLPPGTLTATARISGTWEKPAGSLSFAGTLPALPPQITPAPPGPVELRGEIGISRGLITLRELRVDSPGWRLSAAGTWSGLPSPERLLHDRSGPLPGTLGLRGELVVQDLGWMANGVEKIRRVGGSLAAEIAIEGHAAKPDIRALVRLERGELSTTLALPSLSDVQLELQVEKGGVTVRRGSGALGGAPFTLAGGLTWDGAGGGRADVTLSGENLLFYRADGVKLRADTLLTLRGPLERLELSGRVGITDGEYTRKLDLLSLLQSNGQPRGGRGLSLFSFTRPPWRQLSFQVAIETVRPFRIDNNVAVGTVRPALQLTGTGEQPLLLGEIYVDQLRFTLPTARIAGDAGLVRFLGIDPNRPRLELRARSQQFGYDVSIAVEGPFDAPVVTLTSTPPLPREDLLLLLLAGRSPALRGGRQQTRLGTNVAVYLGRSFLTNLFGAGSERSAGGVLDRFQVEIGREVSRSGEATIDADFVLAKGLFGKDDVLSLTSGKDVNDDYNYGVRLVFRLP